MSLPDYLRLMVEEEASDLLLKLGQPPVIRVDGELQRTKFEPLQEGDTDRIAREALPETKYREFLEHNEADAAYQLDGVGRFRINAFRQRGGVSLAIRRVRSEIPSFEDLHLPAAARDLANQTGGMVLITGPAGTGKTTTITSMIGWINEHRAVHILTIEDPVEVIHDDKMAVIDQREVGRDTESYGIALRSAMRQDPDVIFLGEIRDRETAEAAIQAAETGHLVISTLHTLDATETVNRIIDLFPAESRQQVRLALAASLRGVMSQRLLPRSDGRGRVPAVEVLINNGRVAERIVEGDRTATIRDVMAEGEYYGMQTFDQALVKLVGERLVSVDDAVGAASNPHDFTLALRAAGLT